MKTYITVTNSAENYSLRELDKLKNFIKKEIYQSDCMGIFFYSEAVNLLNKTIKRSGVFEDVFYNGLLKICKNEGIPIFACINSLANREISEFKVESVQVSGLGTLIESIVTAERNLLMDKNSVNFFYNRSLEIKTKTILFNGIDKAQLNVPMDLYIKEMAELVTTALVFEQKIQILNNSFNLYSDISRYLSKEILQNEGLEFLYLKSPNKDLLNSQSAFLNYKQITYEQAKILRERADISINY